MSQPKNNQSKSEILIKTDTKDYRFYPVPMLKLAKSNPESWALFTKGCMLVVGSGISVSEKERLNDYMRRHKTDAVTEDGKSFITTIGFNQLHYCNPFLPEFAVHAFVHTALPAIFNETFNRSNQIYSF